MRIIDKNTDFYDYMQYVLPDDTVVYDRRDSYPLTREEFARAFEIERTHLSRHIRSSIPVLIQAGHKFWLFALEITEYDTYDRCEKYRLELLDKWTDYEVSGAVLKLSYINVSHWSQWWCYERQELNNLKSIAHIRGALHTGDYNERVFNKFKDGNGKEYHTPLLCGLGFGQFIDAQEIYLAMDDYLSSLVVEVTESEGLTNEEKVVNHGFDLKQSFRGK